MSLDNKIQIILILKIQYVNKTSDIYNDMWSIHNGQSMNTHIKYIDVTSKLVPI